MMILNSIQQVLVRKHQQVLVLILLLLFLKLKQCPLSLTTIKLGITLAEYMTPEIGFGMSAVPDVAPGDIGTVTFPLVNLLLLTPKLLFLSLVSLIR